MKKAIFFVGVLLLLSGCGENDTLTCTSANTINGLSSNRTYKIDYKDDDIKMVTVTYDYTAQNTGTNDTNDTTNDDGVGTGTDGTTSDDNQNDNDGVIDGVVGDALDDVVTGVTNTILDIAGIKTTHNNRMTTYNNITGFTSSVDTDRDDNYKVTYKFDLEKMDDADLGKFNLDRSLNTLRTNYTNQGLTCR